jgi:hypothetical protein
LCGGVDRVEGISLALLGLEVVQEVEVGLPDELGSNRDVLGEERKRHVAQLGCVKDLGQVLVVDHAAAVAAVR